MHIGLQKREIERQRQEERRKGGRAGGKEGISLWITGEMIGKLTAYFQMWLLAISVDMDQRCLMQFPSGTMSLCIRTLDFTLMAEDFWDNLYFLLPLFPDFNQNILVLCLWDFYSVSGDSSHLVWKPDIISPLCLGFSEQSLWEQREERGKMLYLQEHCHLQGTWLVALENSGPWTGPLQRQQQKPEIAAIKEQRGPQSLPCSLLWDFVRAKSPNHWSDVSGFGIIKCSTSCTLEFAD